MEVLTYPLSERGKKSVYIYLYERIRDDILCGNIAPGEKLPSKRALAAHLEIAVITVENAYAQLELEGYIYSVQKKGYYASKDMKTSDLFTNQSHSCDNITKALGEEKKYYADFTISNGGADGFPFASWAKLSRRVLLDKEGDFLIPPPGQGVLELREAIADYLFTQKGMSVDPELILIGPGTEYLHHILIQLLGRNIFVAVEDPGYKKVGRIYQSNGVKLLYIPVDKKGMQVEKLVDSNAKLVHTSPSHHFPTGCVMPIDRRQKLLSWAVSQDAYIIEDDYDSEFRFDGKPIATFNSMRPDHVIYMNTFTRSLAPSIRIAYMVLPERLMDKYKEKLFFYSGTVSSFDQYTLATFIKDGYYERHIRRVRNKYRTYRENLLYAIEKSGLSRLVNVHEDRAGFHMIFEVNTAIDEKKFIKSLENRDIKISPLDLYSYNSAQTYKNKYLLCYGDQNREVLIEAMARIVQAIEECQ